MLIIYFREKKREREREELWKRLHELADEIQKSDKTPSLPSATTGGVASIQSSSVADGGSSAVSGTLQLNSIATSNQNNTQIAAGTASSSNQSHSAGPKTISTQMNSMSISTGAGAMSK